MLTFETVHLCVLWSVLVFLLSYFSLYPFTHHLFSQLFQLFPSLSGKEKKPGTKQP